MLELDKIKCNIDRTSRGNSGHNSYEFWLRDSWWYIIYDQGRNIGISSNIEVETVTILKALRYRLTQRIHNVYLETDSLCLRNILEYVCNIPWEIVEEVEEIRAIILSSWAQITHIYKEGNHLDDYYANTTIEKESLHQFHTFQDLPTMKRIILNTEKTQISSLKTNDTWLSNSKHAQGSIISERGEEHTQYPYL